MNRKWVTLHICKRQSHHIFSYDQRVSAHFVKSSLITSFPVTNRLWVTLHILWKAVSSHLSLWPTVCECCCTFCERQSHHICSYDQQQVSDIVHSVKGSLIMTNRKWVTLHILWKAVSSHLFLWPTASEWYCTLYILWKVVSSHLLHKLFQNKEDVCDPFVTSEFIIWNTMAKESQWHCFVLFQLMIKLTPFKRK